MTEIENKRFALREPAVDDTIHCNEISDNGEWVTYGEIVEFLNDLYYENREFKKENKQLRKQIKIFDEFLDGNNLDIDWNELCILDSCIMNDEVECRDCI